MAWFKKARKPIEAPDKASRVPEGLWVKCPSCGRVIYNKELVDHPAGLSALRAPLPDVGDRSAEDALRRRRLDGARRRPAVDSTRSQFADTKPYRRG